MTRHLITVTPATSPPKTDTEVERLRERIERLARPCGCKSGAALTLLALVGWPIRVIADGVPGTILAILAALATYPLVVLGAAILGKGSGIVVGRTRRRWYQHLLRNHLSIAKPPLES